MTRRELIEQLNKHGDGDTEVVLWVPSIDLGYQPVDITEIHLHDGTIRIS